MEENKNVEEVKPNTEKEKEATAQQVLEYVKSLQNKCLQLEGQLKAIDMTAFRLNTLFKVLESYQLFPSEYIEEVTKEIIDILKYEPEEKKPEEEVDAVAEEVTE